MHRSLALAFAVIATQLAAQQATHSISPGMTKAQVVTSLGQPLASRDMGGYTYIFYKNECTRSCGMNDIVVLHSDSVVDAIFRSTTRHYTGTSSSPAPIPPKAAIQKGASTTVRAPMKMPADTATRPTRMRPPPANDTRPSIPVKSPVMTPPPAPSKAATTSPTIKKP